MEINKLSPNISHSLNSPINNSLKRQLSQNFEMMLTNLLFSSAEPAASNLYSSSSSNNILTLSLLSLIQQFLTSPTPQEWILSPAKNVQINQFEAETLVGGDGRNANCGPTSLVMALHALGLAVKGEQEGMNNGQVIDLARLCMVYDPARDGVDSLGRRFEAEHNTYTNLNDIIHGAVVSGANAHSIPADIPSIKSALQNRSMVVVSGTFAGKYPLPWTGDRGIDNHSAPGNATAHIVAITGYNPATDQFLINDPARKTALEVDSETLLYFMRGNSGAVALSRRYP